MSAADLKSVETGAPKTFGANLVSDAVYTPERLDAPQRQSKEPTMRALKRILGVQIEEIFPEGLRESVAAGETFSKEHPDSYLDTEFDDEAERNDVLTVMRAYAECYGDDGLTIATKNTSNPALLRWKVTARRVLHKGETE